MKTIKILNTGLGLINIFHEEIINNKLYINYGEYTRDPMNANDMEPNDVFVAATNLSGLHGGGSARYAHDALGLEWGLGEGLSQDGKVYAFPTLEEDTSTGYLKKISEFRLKIAFETFKQCALLNPNKKFYLTKVGLGIAGWDLETVHKYFWTAGIPFECENVIYPIEFEISSEGIKNW